MYFHGNAEDLGHNLEFLYRLRNNHCSSVIAMEYPGYGIFSHRVENNAAIKSQKLSCTSKQVQKNAQDVFEHLIKPLQLGGLGYRKDQVIIFGRSMGSGPASLLAGTHSPRALILMSPFTSVRDAASNLAGSLLSYLVATHHDNLEQMKIISCPVFLIHGKKDKVIPYQHSETLYNQIKS